MRGKLRKFPLSGQTSHSVVENGRARLPKKRKLEKMEEGEVIDPLIKAENMEIKRLEKLLGINKSKLCC
ncbi:hypothetical protein EON64_06545 [archaeon]|nr:MAG: hypothetical protein EON64_06545 [archaeon]